MHLIKSMLLVFSKIMLFGLGLLLLVGGGSCAAIFIIESFVRLDFTPAFLILFLLAIAYAGWKMMFAVVSVSSNDSNATNTKTENDNSDEHSN